MTLEWKYLIGVPKFEATMCALRIKGEVRQIGRRKAKDIVFQAMLDGDYVKLNDPIEMEGTTMQMIGIYDKDEFLEAVIQYEKELQP
jgi:hypothetical protein